jgi:hypothetical protein
VLAGAWISKAANGIASISIALPQPTDIYRFYFRGSWNKGIARLVVQQQDGSSTTVVGNLNSSLAWVDIKQVGLWQGVTQIQIVSNDSFTLTELAAQSARCFEMATVDMQDVYTVHVIRCGLQKQEQGEKQRRLTAAAAAAGGAAAKVEAAATCDSMGCDGQCTACRSTPRSRIA